MCIGLSGIIATAVGALAGAGMVPTVAGKTRVKLPTIATQGGAVYAEIVATVVVAEVVAGVVPGIVQVPTLAGNGRV